MDYSITQPGALQEVLLRGSLRKMLGEREAENYCLLRWIPLQERMPDENACVLIKFLNRDRKTVCSCPASYKSGQFCVLFTDNYELVLDPAVILGWSYYPYDGR